MERIKVKRIVNMRKESNSAGSEGESMRQESTTSERFPSHRPDDDHIFKMKCHIRMMTRMAKRKMVGK